jgi:hypothetical protein
MPNIFNFSDSEFNLIKIFTIDDHF